MTKKQYIKHSIENSWGAVGLTEEQLDTIGLAMTDTFTKLALELAAQGDEDACLFLSLPTIAPPTPN